ncbi:MAG: 23S rRNA (adenine(2503)-C(2))-methyltransferase RlmN [Chlamydiae bacterium]|nr:23S rRNA (adenine(2503)-C(2))-methyltransferase RlmN [Chlamydiota bacterium]
MSNSIVIFEYTLPSFADEIFTRFGKGKRHAAILYAEFFRYGKFLKKVEKEAISLALQIIQVTDTTLPSLSLKTEEGDTTKFLLRHNGGLESESVIIPMKSGMTLCISSQVGCKMGCAFCETGKLGLLRSFSAKEIVQQVFFAKFVCNAPIRNLVFMGMGEPFDNWEEVKQAINILLDPRGFGFGPSRITVSTSGDVEGIYRFMKEMPSAVNLAVSVNAPNDEIRNRIMPVNKTWNMKALKEALEAYCQDPRREILVEYVLLQGINDSLECADELASYLEGLSVKVNLIPYNSQRKERFSAPSLEDQQAFSKRLQKKGYQTLLRANKGNGIMAACGQLGNIEQRQLLLRQKRQSLPIL